MVIENIGGIQTLRLSFIDGVNVICGASGVGKAMILDIIADAFGIHKPYNKDADKIEIYGEANMPSAKVVVRVHRNPFSRGFYREKMDKTYRREISKRIEDIKSSMPYYGEIDDERCHQIAEAERRKESKYEVVINTGKEKYYLPNDGMYGNYELHESTRNILYFRIKDDSYSSSTFSDNYQQYQCGRISVSEMISVKEWFSNRFQFISERSLWGKYQFTKRIGHLTK